MTLTQSGKEAALKALAERRARNKGKPPHDNSKGYAGEPMYFPCVACGDLIGVPENYLTKPSLCRECQALKDVGWLE